MKKLFFILALLPAVLLADGSRFQHRDPLVQQEFDNVYQTINRKSAFNYYNVKDYNVAGDARTDDGAAIQALLNLINTTGSGVLYFPPGTYIVGQRLTIYSNTTFQGSQIGATTIKAKAGMNDRLLVNYHYTIGDGEQDDNIILQDIIFDLNGANQTASNTPTFVYVKNHHVKRCEFRNPYDSLYELTGAPYTTINTNCYFEDVFFSGAGQQQPTDLMDIGNGTNIRMTRIRAEDAKANTGDAMLSIAIVNDFSLTDSYLDGKNNGVPLLLAGIHGGKVDGNEIKNSYESGMRIAYWLEVQPEKFMENYSITNNNIHDNAYEGIWVRAAGSSTQTIKNLKIDNNSIWNNQKYGIRCQTANGITISNNSIFSNSLQSAGTYAALDFGGFITGSVNSINNVRVYGNNIYDTGTTQTLMYNLAYVSTFTSHNNFASNITTRMSSSNSTVVLDLDAVGEGVRSLVGTFTRDNTTASGSVSYTGIGFKPSGLTFFSTVPSTTTYSWGFDNAVTHTAIAMQAFGASDTWSSESIVTQPNSSDYQVGHVTSLDPDGFTISWTKTGSPTGTARIFYMAQR